LIVRLLIKQNKIGRMKKKYLLTSPMGKEEKKSPSKTVLDNILSFSRSIEMKQSKSMQMLINLN
jgi:hypothetical protein